MAVVKGEATGRSAREKLGVGSGREKKEERIPCLIGDIDLERRGLTPPGSRRDILNKKEKCWVGIIPGIPTGIPRLTHTRTQEKPVPACTGTGFSTGIALMGVG